MLPHRDGILAKRRLVFFAKIGRGLVEDPQHMTVPEAARGVVRVFLLITPHMVPDVISRPLAGRILQRPASRNQQRDLDPRPAFEAPMGNQPVISHGNSPPRAEIQDNEGRPAYPRIPDLQPEPRHAANPTTSPSWPPTSPPLNSCTPSESSPISTGDNPGQPAARRPRLM